MTLLDACREVMGQPKEHLNREYPEGLSAADVLFEIRLRFGADAFPLVSVIDVADEMRSFYGPGSRVCGVGSSTASGGRTSCSRS